MCLILVSLSCSLERIFPGQVNSMSISASNSGEVASEVLIFKKDRVVLVVLSLRS